jgi:predicted glycoside hydrolase/deacetylase ChbG (UPF0249 family)
MSAAKYLIVNADDFGLNRGVTRGIVRAHREGIVTSASLMVRRPAAAEAAGYAREHPELSLGLHCDLGEWAFRDGTWETVYRVVPREDFESVRAEAARQLELFRRLVGRDPTHLDSHQHAHRDGPLRRALAEIAGEISVPLRGCDERVGHRSDFYGQNSRGERLPGHISVGRLVHILGELPRGITELSCHPGLTDDADAGAAYRAERAEELEVLCDPKVRDALDEQGIRLCSFADVAARS